MKSALIAIDPRSERGTGFHRFCDIIQLFQNKGYFSEASIASIIYASQHSVPQAWYREMKEKYVTEALDAVTKACLGRFGFGSIKILLSETDTNESLVSLISQFGRRAKKDLLVVMSQERSGIPGWILGSFSGTAALTADLPILVVKPHTKPSDLSASVRFVVAVDAAAPPSAKSLSWIARSAKIAKAEIDLVYVRPRPRPFIDRLQQRKMRSEAENLLNEMRDSLRAQEVKAKAHVLDDTKSPAHTIVDFAKKRKAWLTITVEAKRTPARKLLLGSTARRILALTERPFLSLRLK